ncbi:uncharacterized protein PHALS_09141 [Plasmopara halstedii]|uniref:Uncharacterized protein n=1 Tax=Plasmopara halstedii TaxID=4781 RepID=A0A0P1AET2_PLAHL|nr:uncharacterized protein PHALS_09141 [Plasmopara halstedii]CEG39079.1 hypothetical protein PHALS_09141 [Plasmopara halstedii]|eukprot:XP_024575448.1 hypothetical protein PHALS_09141 [Plasmopara halstedii]
MYSKVNLARDRLLVAEVASSRAAPHESFSGSGQLIKNTRGLIGRILLGNIYCRLLLK